MVTVNDKPSSTELLKPPPYHIQLPTVTSDSQPTQQHLTLLWINHLRRYQHGHG